MPAKVNLPKISLPMTVLPSINLYTNVEDNEFTFNQPLTIEQFSLQFAEKSCKKKHKIISTNSQNTDIEMNIKNQPNLKIPSPNCNISSNETFIIKDKKVAVTNNDTIDNSYKNDKLEFSEIHNDSKNTSKTMQPCSDSKLEFTKPLSVVFESSPKKLETKNQFASEKLPTELKKWSCDACWVSNNADVIKCIACQTPKSEKSQTPLKVIKPSTWTCETCWVPNKNEIDACVACQTQKPGTTKKSAVQITWTCDGCWVKNKSDCTTCISCGTAKIDSAPENKPLPSTQFKFGLNNNTFEKSGASQFKFGFDSNKADQPSNTFQFGSSTPFTSSDNGKSNTSTSEFKFGISNNKTDQPLTTFKFGSDSTASVPVKKISEVSNSNNSETQFRFGFEKKPDKSEGQLKIGLSVTTNKPTMQFKFGSDKIEVEQSFQQNSVDSNIVAQSTNELKSLVNNKNEESEISLDLQNKSNKRKVNDVKEKSSPQLSFGSVKNNNCNDSNSLVNDGLKNEDSPKIQFVWDKKMKKNETNPLTNFGSIQPVQSAVVNTNQLVNGHSNPKEISNEDQKPGLIKTSQLFSFGSFAKQDQNVQDDQNNHKMFTFGTATNDQKSFASAVKGTSSFPSTAPVFGATNSIFGSGPSTSTPATLGSSIPATQFSFGSLAPQVPNSFFSQANSSIFHDNDKKTLAQTTNSFNSTNVGFSFGAQSPPVFSVPNAGNPVKMSTMVITKSKYILK